MSPLVVSLVFASSIVGGGTYRTSVQSWTDEAAFLALAPHTTRSAVLQVHEILLLQGVMRYADGVPSLSLFQIFSSYRMHYILEARWFHSNSIAVAKRTEDSLVDDCQ